MTCIMYLMVYMILINLNVVEWANFPLPPVRTEV